ncbi:hypothetical protein [Aequorivita ciconiae]|nr:hypothetical protein [Aequorivita sp. H23M31]
MVREVILNEIIPETDIDVSRLQSVTYVVIISGDDENFIKLIIKE